MAASYRKKTHSSWLAFRRIRGFGCTAFKRLANSLEDPTEIFSLSSKELANVPGLDKSSRESILRFSEWDEVEEEVNRVLAAGVRIVTFADAEYPERLKTIADPPPFIYLKGHLTQADKMAVAVVGSRSASPYGVRVTQELCHGLTSLGFTVVSGMARGIDGEAHETALEAQGRTLAVLGSGVDVVYPREHEELYDRITQHGAVISELPLGTPPMSHNFPSRNRLISGLSLGVLVVEATEKSGSLITAELALDQGRDVFAVPGQAGASRSRGTHRLIRQGAKLVEDVKDIVEELAPQITSSVSESRQIASPFLPSSANPEAKKIWEMVLEGPLHIDDLIQESGLPIARISEILLDLELQGYLKELPGKRFQAK